MGKKQYCAPVIQALDFGNICETGLRSDSHYTEVRKMAVDQTDVILNEIQIEENPIDNVILTWD